LIDSFRARSILNPFATDDRSTTSMMLSQAAEFRVMQMRPDDLEAHVHDLAVRGR
jgi:hypothetical protein